MADDLARLPGLLDRLRQRFTRVLIDAPAWGSAPLTGWVKAADASFLVVRERDWDAPHVDAAHDGLRRAGAKLRGCVTTR